MKILKARHIVKKIGQKGLKEYNSRDSIVFNSTPMDSDNKSLLPGVSKIATSIATGLIFLEASYSFGTSVSNLFRDKNVRSAIKVGKSAVVTAIFATILVWLNTEEIDE